MQRWRRRGDELASFLELCNLPSDSQVDLNFPDDVLAQAQGDPVQNNGRLENRNLMQNPNPFSSNLHPNQNREEEQSLFSPFANVFLDPNLSNLTEPWRQPYYQPNPELCMPSNLLSNRNQEMARSPCQYNTNVVVGNSNIASTSRGETNISLPSRKRGDEYRSIQTQSTALITNHPSYSGTGNSAFQSAQAQQNIERFVRSTRMRLDPGQARTSMGTVSPGTAQSMGLPKPNLNPVQAWTSMGTVSPGTTQSVGLPKPNLNPGQPRTNMGTVSPGTAQSIGLPKPNLNPGQPRTNMGTVSPGTAQSIGLPKPNLNPGQPRTSMGTVSPGTAQSMGLPKPNLNLGQAWTSMGTVSPGTAQSMGLPKPNLNPGQARTSMGTVSPGTAQYMGLPRPNLNPGHLMPASNTLPTPLAGGAFIPRVGTNMSHMPIIPETTTAPAAAPVQAARVISQSQYTVNEALPVALPLSHHQRAQNAAVPVPVLAQPALITAQRTVSHQQPIRSIVSSGASDIRSQGAFVYQAVPTIPSAPASSAVSQFVPNSASTSLPGNGVAPLLQERPRSLPFIRNRPVGGTANASPSQVQLADNMIRNREPRIYYRHGRQIEVLLITTEMLDEWRQIDRHHDMRLDIDSMSFEELVALGERIGTVNTGVSEQTVNKLMRCRPFSDLLGKDSEPCCICQEEYVETDEVGTLDCGHDFHPECIKKWLAQKNICPICKVPGIKS